MGDFLKMFAVIKTGGLQYCVKPGDVIKINKIDVEPENSIEVSEVLMFSDDKNTKIGTPQVSDVSVKLQVLRQMRNEKVVIFKKHRRHNYRRKKGHRQPMTLVKVTDIIVRK